MALPDCWGGRIGCQNVPEPPYSMCAHCATRVAFHRSEAERIAWLDRAALAPVPLVGAGRWHGTRLRSALVDESSEWLAKEVTGQHYVAPAPKPEPAQSSLAFKRAK